MRIVFVIIFLSTGNSVAQEPVLECDDFCFDPDLSLKEGDVFAWEFTNTEIMIDQNPHTIISLRIELLQPLNGLSTSVIDREPEYLDIIATTLVPEFGEEDTFQENQVTLSSLPVPMIFTTIANVNGSLVNAFESFRAENSDWDDVNVFGSGITLYTDHSVGNRTIENAVYTFSQSTRLEAFSQNQITVSYHWIKFRFEVETGVLIDYNSTVQVPGGIPIPTLIKQVGDPRSKELTLDFALLIIIGGSLIGLIIILVLAKFYINRRKL